MPIYEYRCSDCSHQIEKLQKISDPPLTECPACGKPSLTKLVSAAAFRLKGGGWYETDFKKDGKRNLAGDGDAKEGAAKDDGGREKAKSDGAADKPASASKDSSSSEGGGKKSDTKASSSSNSGKAA